MTHADKSRAQPRTASTDSARNGGATLVDNRPEAIAQRELAQAVERSARVTAQREASDAIQSSSLTQRKPLTSGFGDTVQARKSPGEAAPRANNTGLPDNLKSGVESLAGMSLDNVKVHYNSARPAQLEAHAYAQGSDIHLAPGQEQHLPHEAWHVVQQAQGRVKPTMQMTGGVAVNDDKGLEDEADVMGAKALKR
jgi:hypothetical protein